MADTAPVYASAFFSNPGAVYGLATVGQIPVGIAGGGMGAIVPLASSLVGYNVEGVVGRFTSPVVSGTMSADGFRAGSRGIGSTGDLTVTGGATALCTLTVASTATFSGGLSLAAGSLTVAEGNLGLTGNLTVTGTTTLSATLPVEPQHAATKAYVDSVASGLHIKAAVRARTTGALPEYSVTGSNTLTATGNEALDISIFDGVAIVGTTFVEGVAVEGGTRVLVANEPAGSPDLRPNNGIYVVTSVGGISSPWVLTRAEDADESAELRPGSFVFVTGGEDYQGDGFVLTTSDGADPTVGTTPLVFTQFSEAGTITPGGVTGQFQVKNGADFDGTALLTLTDGVVTATGPIAVGTPSENGHAATKLYVDSEIAAIPATAPAGSSGQVQFNSSGAFGGSAALAFDSATRVLSVGSIEQPGRISVAGTLAASTVEVGTGGFISTGGLAVNAGGATFAGSTTFDGAVECATAVTLLQGPSNSNHAATKEYVDTAVAGVASAPPDGSDGQFQYKDGSAFAGSAALTHGEGEVAVRGAAFSVYGTGEVPSQILSVGGSGVVISGGAEHTLSAGTGSIDDSPGIVINSGSIAIYGDGIGSGKSNLTADADGVSITRAYEISSGSGKPIRLKGDPAVSGDLPGATGYVAVGAISGQAGGQEGAAVAFGAGAGVTAPRGIALGMGAVARVADAAVIPALSLSQNVADAAAAVSRSGLAAYAAGMTFLPSAPLDLKTAFINTVDTPSSYSSFEVPAGAMFIPLGAVVWLHAIVTTGAFSASPTLEVRRASASGGVILPATALAIAQDSLVGLAVGATPSDFSAVSGGGVIFYRVATAASAGGLSSASARVALYGLCVEL